MIAADAFSRFVRTRGSDGSAISLPDRMLLTGAAVIVIGVFIWLTPVVLAYLDGASVTGKVRNNSDRAGLFIIHVITGTIALSAGCLQLFAPFRSAYPNLHRWIGRSYVLFVLISAGTSLGLSPRLSTYGTDLLRPFAAVLWGAFTIFGVMAIRQMDVESHRRWMIRSYALTYMGLTFLFLSAIRKISGVPLEYGYPVVIWLSFLINVSVGELVARRSRPLTSDPLVRRFGNLDAAAVDAPALLHPRPSSSGPSG